MKRDKNRNRKGPVTKQTLQRYSAVTSVLHRGHLFKFPPLPKCISRWALSPQHMSLWGHSRPKLQQEVRGSSDGCSADLTVQLLILKSY